MEIKLLPQADEDLAYWKRIGNKRIMNRTSALLADMFMYSLLDTITASNLHTQHTLLRCVLFFLPISLSFRKFFLLLHSVLADRSTLRCYDRDILCILNLYAYELKVLQ